MTILSVLREHDGAAPAVRIGDRVIDYARLLADMDALSAHLRDCGLEAGARVSLHPDQPGSPTYGDWLLHLAALQAGLVHSSTVKTGDPRIRKAFGMREAAIGSTQAKMPDGPARKIRIDFSGDAPLADLLKPESAPPEAGDEAQAKRLLSTSGTTGTPKIVEWDAAMIAARVAQVREEGHVSGDTKLMPLLGFPTTAGYRYPLAVWQAGGCVTLFARGQHVFSSNNPAMAETDTLISSPYRLKQALEREQGEWPGREARTVHLFGGRVDPDLLKQAKARVGAVCQTHYGSTETGSVASGDLDMIERHAGAVGRPGRNVELRIVDGKGQERAPGQTGIVEIRTPVMIAGYATGEGGGSFRDGWFRPGDLGVLLEDGTLAIEGRTSETINVGGLKLSPVAIEQRLAQIKALRDVALVAVPVAGMERLVIAYVSDRPLNGPKLRAVARRAVQSPVPFTLVRVRQIPRNQAGKIERVKLGRGLLAAYRQRMQNSVAKKREMAGG
jgi:acyl-CoA synthetase (AMP-forming)/AMP-acid ligase II